MVQGPETATCIQCGYTLLGLVEPVCPECGRRYDPQDESTFVTPSSGPSWRSWSGAPKAWHTIACLFCLIAFLVPLSAPAAYGSLWPCTFATIAFVAAPALFVNYLVRAIATRCDAHHPKPQRLGPWLMMPSCFIVFLSALLTGWPLQVRFSVSRAAFEKAAPRVDNVQRETIGAYFVVEGYTRPYGAVFVIEYVWLDTYAFVRSVSGPPPRRIIRDLGNGWYAIKEPP